MKKDSLLLRAIRHSLVFYGCYLPDHPGKWPVIKRISKSLKLHKVTPLEMTVERNGIAYRLDITDAMDRILYYRGVHECLETKLCRHIIRPGFTCLDVGANLGYYTLLFAKLTNGIGAVHAFEPCPEEAERLCRNVSLNRFANIKIHPFALADTSGKIGITERKKGGNTRIAATIQEKCHEIDVMTLDEFAAKEKIANIDLMKIDVEGAEVKFLKGGPDTISRCRPVMIIELNPKALGRFGNRVSEVSDFLHTRRYDLYTLSRRGLKRFDRMPETEHINVVAFPENDFHKKDRLSWKHLKKDYGTRTIFP